MDNQVKQAYEAAKALYAQHGIDTDEVLNKLAEIKVSVHCWQGDDVKGFLNKDGELTGVFPLQVNIRGLRPHQQNFVTIWSKLLL